MVDPLIILLLFVRPRVGVVLLIPLMLSDAVHHTWIIERYGGIV